MEKAGEFVGRVFGDFGSTFAIVCCAVGDRLGLFKDLAGHGPHTSDELAECAGVSPRYVREWASCLTVHGYLTYDPASGKFALPAEHAPALAQEPGPMFLGGFFQQSAALLGLYEPLVQAFKDGQGIAPDLYTQEIWKGEYRANEMWHNHLLVQEWLPKMPEVRAKLEEGARVADVGSGSGRVLVRLAQAFPKSTFVGFDIDPESVERARAFAKSEGVSDRVTFEVHDLMQGVPGAFDIVGAFDVVHDTADPLGLMKSVRKALNPGGHFVVLEINGADRLEDNVAPFGTVFYGISLTFCMSIAIARGGEGLGTAGLPEGRLREYAATAGFSGVRRIDIGDPVQALFEVSA